MTVEAQDSNAPLYGPPKATAHEKARPGPGSRIALRVARQQTQWNCSSSVEPVSAFTLDEPPWITVVTSSK